MMSDAKSFINMPWAFTALAISSLPIAYYLSKSFVSGCSEYNQQHESTAASESTPLDDTVKHPNIEANSKYDSLSLPTTTQLPDYYRAGNPNSFTTTDKASGLFVSVTPSSSMGVLTRENILTSPSRTLCDEVRARPCAIVFQLSERETVTSRSRLSNKSLSAVEQKTEKNRSESVKGETEAHNTFVTGLKFLCVATARPLKTLHAFAPNNLALSSVYCFSRLMTGCHSTERLREAHAVSNTYFTQCSNRNRPFRFKKFADSEDKTIDNDTDAGSTAPKTEPVTNEFLLHSALSVLFIPWLLTMSAAVIFETNTLG